MQPNASGPRPGDRISHRPEHSRDVGLEHVRTIADDPAFGGCRDTLVFEGPWAAFVRNVQELSFSQQALRISPDDHAHSS